MNKLPSHTYRHFRSILLELGMTLGHRGGVAKLHRRDHAMNLDENLDFFGWLQICSRVVVQWGFSHISSRANVGGVGGGCARSLSSWLRMLGRRVRVG
jgi:hypothetical protein